jgi:predicted transcriptional regulator
MLKDGLAGLTAREIMLTDCPAVSSVMTLEHLTKEVARSTGRQSFPVVGGGRVIGLITMLEVRAIPREAWAKTTVGSAMKLIDEVQAVPPETGAYEVLERMAKANLNQILVIENGKWQGMITREQILTQSQLNSHHSA